MLGICVARNHVSNRMMYYNLEFKRQQECVAHCNSKSARGEIYIWLGFSSVSKFLPRLGRVFSSSDAHP